MDYEKLYKQALENAKRLYEQGTITESLAYIFPELKESESDGERIRKGIIKYLSWIKDRDGSYMPNNIPFDDMMTWLEKQGEQKPACAWSEEDERLCKCIIKDQEDTLDNVKNDKYGHSEIISDLKEMYRERIDWLKSLKQRIGG